MYDAKSNDVYVLAAVDCLLDLNFVVDSSGSISRRDWNTTLQFVANVASLFEIGPDDVQVAFVIFSDVATVEWSLTRYPDKTTLINAIYNVSYIGSSTNLNDGLYLTRSVVFAAGRGVRDKATKVTVILTDGVDNVPEVGTPWTIENATLCKNDGIWLIAIGVSDGIDSDRLLQIATSPEDFYAVADFEALADITGRLSTHICNVSFPASTFGAPCFIYRVAQKLGHKCCHHCRVGYGSLLTDPTRPDPSAHGPNPTRPTTN